MSEGRAAERRRARGAAGASAAAPFRLEQDGSLTHLILEHPPLNLFDGATFDSLEACVGELAADPPRGVLVRAVGRVVSAGVDVAEFEKLTATTAGQLWMRLVGVVRAFEALPCPTIFSAHSLTLTAAFELSLGCDLIVASESASFGLVENVIGLTPGMGGTQRLAARAGAARAREFVMTGDRYDAATLHSLGRRQQGLAGRGAGGAGAGAGPPPRRRPDPGPRGDQADGGDAAGRRDRRRRHRDAADLRRPVRHRGPAESGPDLPPRGPGPRDLRGPLAGTVLMGRKLAI